MSYDLKCIKIYKYKKNLNLKKNYLNDIEEFFYICLIVSMCYDFLNEFS